MTPSEAAAMTYGCAFMEARIGENSWIVVPSWADVEEAFGWLTKAANEQGLEIREARLATGRLQFANCGRIVVSSDKGVNRLRGIPADQIFVHPMCSEETRMWVSTQKAKYNDEIQSLI